LKTNFSKELWNQIINQAEMNMGDGKCSMYRNIYIPLKVRQGGYDELKTSEKIFFHDGIRDGRWTKSGVHLQNNNPYKETKRITEYDGF
tara:strand:+ start:441 stop:707 length:267 start_codon:yes stop_codon:yes gene_type:complete